jgi:dihydropteroate synthase
MGVLNVTPDSFSDGGQYRQVNAAVDHGLRMVEEGAAIIDVGGESTRPGADPVYAEEEIRRVVPVIEKLRAQTDAVISVDTSKPQVMRAAAAAGAGLINDVRALSEKGALEAAVASECAVCLMHMQGDPQSMQLAPHYDDVVSEVKAFLEQRVHLCRAAGIGLSRKSIVGRLTGRPAGERVYGSVALAVISVMNGARIVRVHDVGATVDALKTVTAVLG